VAVQEKYSCRSFAGTFLGVQHRRESERENVSGYQQLMDATGDFKNIHESKPKVPVGEEFTATACNKSRESPG
jgi:hypothetical protein